MAVDIREAFDMARDSITTNSWDADAAKERLDRFAQALQAFETQAWERGYALANSFADASTKKHVELLLQVAASLQGKDRADGIIRFEVYPDPDIYDRTVGPEAQDLRP